MWGDFDEAPDEDVVSQDSPGKKAESTMHDYFLGDYIPRTSSPFAWWSGEGKRKFPELYELALKYLSIPASSVPSERVFSTGGEVL